ncbi:MAG: hypothetical protein PHD51_04625 [Patescibacteria group bacterium]|nr:hypothetical protein [Patescibacteria group bacterium]MDD5490789.1 hypothetical protein [Patescibacteria group bacterium]
MVYLITLIGVIIGALLVLKSEWLLQNFGRIDWAEIKLGAEGGTRLFWKLIGLAIILLSLLYMTGTVQDILVWIFVR